MREITIKVHSIGEDGLPDMDALTGQVAFLWDGNIISGWPLARVGKPDDHWEPAEDRFGGELAGVTHWVEFPEPVWNYERTMPTDPTPAGTVSFGQAFAGGFGAFTVCLMCGALLADGGKDLHREWHEAINPREETP